MPTFDSFDDNFEEKQNVSYGTVDLTKQETRGSLLTRVFLVMFIGLLLTTLIAAGLGVLFQNLIYSTGIYNDSQELVAINDGVLTAMIVLLIGSAIGVLIMSFVLPITFARGKHNILVPFIIYVCLMGILLSSFTFTLDWRILVEAFGVTSLVFGLMALLGYLSKGRMAGIGVILLGLLIGSLLLTLLNFLLMLFGGIRPENQMIAWIVSFMVFALVLFVTMWDVGRIAMIAKNSYGDNNLVYYCAYILYSDFISILIRIIYYLAIITGGRRR